MNDPDIRWIQRYSHYTDALAQLTKFIEKGELNPLEKQGLIQSFEYSYELAWNTIKDYFDAQGETDIHGSRDAFRLAFKRGLIADGKTWMDMIKSRTLTVHTYNEALAEEISIAIVSRYFPAFVALRITLQSLTDRHN